MSIAPGSTIFKDPQAEKVYTFDWSAWLVDGATIATSEFFLAVGSDDALTISDDEILIDATSTQCLLSGGTLGKTYTVTNRIVTNESPAQTDDASVRVKIASA